MIVLGLDPAIRTTGYGVIEFAAGKWSIRDCGVIRNTAKASHSECLRRLYGGVDQLVEAFQPDSASLEETIAGRNPGTAIILGMARGAILSALANRGVAAYTYTPSQAKKAAVGRGDAAKEQVAVMMAAIFAIDAAQIPLDATDALALALCHAQLAARPEVGDLLTRRV